VKPGAALLLSAALIAATWWAMPALTRVDFVDEASIRRTLPADAGRWKGQAMRFCQNPEHGELVLVDDTSAAAPCPECGGALHPLSIFERSVLPQDTRADKRQFNEDASFAALQVAIVFSGRDRSSIHRPEVCLVGEGSEIVGSRRRSIEMPGRAPLEVQVVDVQITRRQPDGSVVSGRTFFAYWFTGRGHETPSHLVRMFWMAWDRVVHNRVYPWAYISIGGVYDQPGDLSLRRLDDLVRQLYPLLHTDASAPQDSAGP